MKTGTILSLEQATALPYGTMRFVQLGWRVIRIEATGDGPQPGDANRYAGREVAGADRHAAFIAPNVGKEAIGLNLKHPEGQALLRTLLTSLDVDVFCCNVMPMRYTALGIDYETLSAAKPDLIWAAISALGPDFPDVPGYDPIIQAMSGIMDLTGDPDGLPTLVGLPLTDLKAGDELYSSILLALLQRAQGGGGKRIDVSMLQAATSWLISALPLIDLGDGRAPITRTGSAHRQFVPTNVYPGSDGHIFLAIGSNAQWSKLTALGPFKRLDRPEFATLEQRAAHRLALYAELGAITASLRLGEMQALFAGAGLPHSTINPVPQIVEHPAIVKHLQTTEIDGATIRLCPPAVAGDAPSAAYTLAPRYGEHTDTVLAEAGLDNARIAELRHHGIVA
jgi:itaconate CoA-transferase